MATAKNKNEQFTAYLRRVKASYEAAAGIKEHNGDVRGYCYDMGHADAADIILKQYEKIMKGRK